MDSTQDSKSLSKERYTQYGGSYITSLNHAKGAELNLLVEMAQPEPTWIMLDVATGGGHTALKFSPYVQEVIATDITPKMVERAGAFITGLGAKNVQFEPADAENLPFNEERFDLVTCRIAAHHFPDPTRFIRESVRVLRRGGLLLVQDQMLPEDNLSARYVDRIERLRDPSHNRAYSQSEWMNMFQGAGLNIERIEQVVKKHILVAWAKRQGCSVDTIDRLEDLINDAPPIAADWLEAQINESKELTFVNHHILICGRKAG
jgi:SAM-dependent methyltransferase